MINPILLEVKNLDDILEDYQIDGIDPHDYPDLCDAFIDNATFKNGQELTGEELDFIQDKHSAWISEKAIDIIHNGYR
jgi:hypothetical protein